MAEPKITILTPMKDASPHLDRYVANLEELDFPRERLSVGILESDSRDDTRARLQDLLPRLRARFSKVGIWHRDYGFRMPPDVPRWAPAYQLERRAILARCRNQLMFRALDEEDWVLWLDVDVIAYPADLVQRLLGYRRDILHAHCVLEPGGATFDRNAWRDGGKTMDTMRGTGEPVRLDAVGGTVLLVKADLHRDGLVFPPFRYGVENSRIRNVHPVWTRGEVETEGLGIMALDMGSQCWGLPDLEVIHARS